MPPRRLEGDVCERPGGGRAALPAVPEALLPPLLAPQSAAARALDNMQATPMQLADVTTTGVATQAGIWSSSPRGINVPTLPDSHRAHCPGRQRGLEHVYA